MANSSPDISTANGDWQNERKILTTLSEKLMKPVIKGSKLTETPPVGTHNNCTCNFGHLKKTVCKVS